MISIVGMFLRESNKQAHNTVDSTRTAIIQAEANTSKEQVTNACGRFQSHVEAMLKAGGGQIQYLAGEGTEFGVIENLAKWNLVMQNTPHGPFHELVSRL